MTKHSNRKLIKVNAFVFAIACGASVGLALFGTTVFWLVALLFGLGFIFQLMELRKNGSKTTA